MDEASLSDLRQELADLQAQEQQLSAERDRLHHQIDFGFESGATRERELDVSAARRELHERIDLLSKIVNARHVD
jgi:uncharacterized protein YlxW (UPF0749 family)